MATIDFDPHNKTYKVKGELGKLIKLLSAMDELYPGVTFEMFLKRMEENNGLDKG